MSNPIWDESSRDKSLGYSCTFSHLLLFLQPTGGQQGKEKKKTRKGERSTHCVSRKNKANLKVIERAVAEAAQWGVEVGGGEGWKQVQGERFRLQRCAVGTPPLSLVLFINLFHPPRASSDPHSSQREAIAFRSLLIPLPHTYCAHLYEAQSAREQKGQRTTGRLFVFSFRVKVKR